MSSIDKLINRRRSIRKYKTNLPRAEWIDRMINCAARAPSPANSQPVRFIQISSPGIRDNLYQAMAAGRQRLLQAAGASDTPKRLRNWIRSYWRFSEFIFNAPLLFAVGTVLLTHGFSGKLLQAGIIKRDNRVDTNVDIAVGLALKGFLLKGGELGLGACVLTAPLVFAPNIEEIFGLKDIQIKCFVTVGFPDEEPRLLEKKSGADIYFKI